MGYSAAAVEDRLQLDVDETLVDPATATTHRARLGPDRLSSVIRLFLLREEVGLPSLSAQFDLTELSDIIVRDGDAVRAKVALQPWRDLLVAHDWKEHGIARHHVVGVSSVSTTLANLTVRRRGEHALDLCAGSGVQAMLAARHMQDVVAVDLNPRALLLAGWTLALNGVDNVDLRQGDLWQPVVGEKFDLIVAAPPFVLSPDERWLFRDAGGRVAQISESIVRDAPTFLSNGGFGQILCHWPLASGEPWDQPPRDWVDGAGCDAWILRLPSFEDPHDYAVGWNSFLRAGQPQEFERAVKRWSAWFASTGVERILFGLVTLRRREGDVWTRSDESRGVPGRRSGDHVERVFAGQTLSASMSDDRLLEAVVTPTDSLQLSETRAYRDGRFESVSARVRIDEGVPLRVRLTRWAIETMSQLDGRRSLRAALPESADAERVVPVLRELVALGYLDVELE